MTLESTFGILQRSLRTFCRCARFRAHAKGWVRGIEVTWNEEHGFHPHAHMFVESRFWPADEIAKCWVKSVAKSGGQTSRRGVDVREMKDVGTGLDEALGYSVKAANITEMDDPQVQDVILVLDRKHLIQSSRGWGQRAAKLEQENKDLGELEQERDGRFRVLFTKLCEAARDADHPLQELVPSAVEFLAEVGGYQDAVEKLQIAGAEGGVLDMPVGFGHSDAPV